MSKNNYVGGKKASEILGVHQRTLYQWESKGWIETIRMKSGKRMYNVEKYMKDIKQIKYKFKNLDDCEDEKKKLKICYMLCESIVKITKR